MQGYDDTWGTGSSIQRIFRSLVPLYRGPADMNVLFLISLCVFHGTPWGTPWICCSCQGSSWNSLNGLGESWVLVGVHRACAFTYFGTPNPKPIVRVVLQVAGQFGSIHGIRVECLMRTNTKPSHNQNSSRNEKDTQCHWELGPEHCNTNEVSGHARNQNGGRGPPGLDWRP